MSDKNFYIPAVDTHWIESKHVDQTYQIRVMQPIIKKGEMECFPVLYLTDGSMNFDFAKGVSHLLQVAGQVRRFILVGICYPGEIPFAGTVLRQRDLTPAHRRVVMDWPKTSPLDGVPEIEDGKKNWGGALEFLAFIQKELMPFIDARYPTLPGESAFAGHSLGGGLGLHVMFGGAGPFNRYLISSPGLSYDGDDHAFCEVQEFIASGKRLDAKVLMTVGGEEEFDIGRAKSQFVSNFYRLAALLHKARIAGFDFSSRIYPGETHMSVYPIAFSHGVQTLFGPAERPPLSK